MATISDPLMDTGQNFIGLTALGRTLFRLHLSASRFGEGFFIPAEETGVGNERTVGQSGELVQANVDADRFGRSGKRFRCVLADEAGEPLSCKAADRAGLRGSDQWPVNEAIHLSDFGHVERVADEPASRSLRLRKRDAVIHAAPFQARIPWCLTRFYAAEEGFEGKVNADRDILQNLRMYVSQFRMRFLPPGQPWNLVVHRERLLFRFVDCRAFRHHAVVNITADRKSGTQRGFLRSGRKQTVLYASDTHDHVVSYTV